MELSRNRFLTLTIIYTMLKINCTEISLINNFRKADEIRRSKCQSKDNIDGKIELHSTQSLQNPGFMVLARIALRNRGKLENLTEI